MIGITIQTLLVIVAYHLGRWIGKKLLPTSILIALLGVATTAQAETVVVAYTATWCKYCQAIKPEIVQAQKDGFDIRFADVDDAATKKLPGFPNKIPAAVAIDSKTMKLLDTLPNERLNPQSLKRFVAKYLLPKAPAMPTKPEKPGAKVTVKKAP